MLKQKNKLFGLRIATARKEMSLNQTEFAEKINISKTSLARFETSIFEPSNTILKKISEITGKPISYFFGEQQIGEPQAGYGTAKYIVRMELQLEEMKKEIKECKDKFNIIMKRLEKLGYSERNPRTKS